MRLIHTADLHIGRSIGDHDLTADQEYILTQILDIATEKKADALIVAGDVYDRSLPSENAVRLFDGFLKQIGERGLRAFIISGNHDSDSRLDFGSGFFRPHKIDIRAGFDGTLHHETLSDEYGEAAVYSLPFVKASHVKHYYPDEEIASYEDAIRCIIEHTDIDKSRRNILIAHQFVAGGGADPLLAGSEGTAVKSVGTVERISPDVFADFDYVALGHIHSPQSIGREAVRYAGSPLKYSLSEAGHVKSVTLITLSEKGNIDIEAIPLKPKRDLRHIRGPLKSLMDNAVDTEDLIYATLTDEDFINDAPLILRQVYPNTVSLDYDNSHVRSLMEENVEVSGTGGLSFQELVSGFYEKMYGGEISPEEMEILNEAAADAGLISGS